MDGTWKYADSLNNSEEKITKNQTPFNKSDESTFLLKSKDVNVGFWINPKKWSFKKAADNEAAEYELQLKNGDLYGLIVTEKASMPIITLKLAALENARSIAPDSRIISQEYRNVNGVLALAQRLDRIGVG